MTVYLVNDRKDTVTEYPDRAAAEEQKQDLIGLGMDSTQLEITPNDPREEPKSDGGQTATEVVEESREKGTVGPAPETVKEAMPDEKPSVDEDPVDWMPGHFVDNIQGTPTVNRKGYAVIASQYNVSVEAEPITLASKTDFEYAEFRAVAETEGGQVYSGFGSAHVDRQDGDDQHLLNELAETRAMKRAVAWATGVGMTAVEELQGEL